MMRNYYKRKTEDRWTREDLQRALTLITVDKCKVCDVGKQFGISRSTLYRRVKRVKSGLLAINDFGGKYSRITFGEGRRVLTNNQEQEFEEAIVIFSDQGSTFSTLKIKQICFEYCRRNGVRNNFEESGRLASDEWYFGFLERHPNIKRYIEDSVDHTNETDSSDEPMPQLKREDN